jgi:preprotein translocase subunit SecA
MNRPDNLPVSQDTVDTSAVNHFRPASMLKNFLNTLTGGPVKIRLDAFREIVRSVKATDFSGKAGLQLAERMVQIGRAFRAGCAHQDTESADSFTYPSPEIEIETFALVREASRRSIGLDPFDVQLIAGMAMARGCIAELPTGEGKTLAAVFTACLRALSGRGVHILTFNDYLARRDASWMGPIYRTLGLSVGCVQEGMIPAEKRAGYGCDITYATAKEAGFDFLRDQTAYDRNSLVHRRFNFALVDEADSILIDEARIPLVISGAEDRASSNASRLASLVEALIPGKDFETDEDHRNVFLTDAGIGCVESKLECGSLYVDENRSLLEAIYCALHAEALLRRDVDYIVRDGRIEIVDEYTGRVVDKRHWPDGLQAAVEAKEGLRRRTEGRVLGSITLQHFFHLYPAVSGMTATAQSSADELSEFYGMNVVVIPPHTTSIRVDHADVVFAHREAKRRAIVSEIRKTHALGRPILVGTASVKESEELAGDLRSAGIKCAILNAKNDELEADVIARAGTFGAVTISTNMAGRGVDIKLGGDEEQQRDAVTAVGGLYIIGTNRHESIRIDHQLRGRAGRQGDPGSTRFFISLEDDLFERHGLTKMLMARHTVNPQDGAIPRGSIHREIAHAQRIIEGQNFDIRRSLSKFSSLVDLQRQIVQTRRKLCLSGSQCADEAGAVAMFSFREPALFEEGVRRFGPGRMAELESRATLFHLDRLWSNHLAWIQDTRDSIHLVNVGGREPLDEFRKWATEEFLKMQNAIDEAVVLEMAGIIRKDGPVALDFERLKGPSSTWTYLVNESQFGWGMEMLKGKNIGFAAMAMMSLGPLYIFALLMDRIFRRKRTA